MERAEGQAVAIQPRGKEQGRKSERPAELYPVLIFLLSRSSDIEACSRIRDRKISVFQTLIPPCPGSMLFSRENDKAWKVSQVPRGTEEELPAAVMTRRVHRLFSPCNQTDYERTGETRSRFCFSFIRSNDHRTDPSPKGVHRRVPIRSLIVNFAPPCIDIGFRIEKPIRNHFRSSTAESFFFCFFSCIFSFYIQSTFSFLDECIYFSIDCLILWFLVLLKNIPCSLSRTMCSIWRPSLIFPFLFRLTSLTKRLKNNKNIFCTSPSNYNILFKE